jgi:hypothetical protein
MFLCVNRPPEEAACFFHGVQTVKGSKKSPRAGYKDKLMHLHLFVDLA